ncbi:phosphonate metabolism transcriptional regulator PhnF [Marinimicrococcus flavescens]|uniref:Phosphonate metabolism transcriptional regulator PhnF n=1 Tax=Marinimicrococcus flavescens TaxID=3031815 RepID=A0AAP3V0Q8_9PROT|nr:phosphonate metabolism transcriptional regulator PhnF [Marinimicrococcus flavescens]
MTADGRMQGEELEREGGIALWRQVATRLASEIRGRGAAEDPRLPPESALAERFGVNRHTVRQALRHLAEQGIVRTERGRGTFVNEVMVHYSLGEKPRFGASLLAGYRLPGRRVLDAVAEPADETVARHLGLAAGTMVLRVRSLGLADGVPVCLGQTWLEARRFPDAAAELEAEGSFTRLFARHRISDYRRATTRLQARRASREEAALLQQPVGEPVLATEALDVTPDGTPLSFAVTSWAASRVDFTVEAPAAPAAP